MAKYEFLVRTTTKRARKQAHGEQGDIVEIRDAGHPWSCDELRRFLVVPVECDLSLTELRNKYTGPAYPGGDIPSPPYEEYENGIPPKAVSKHVASIPLDRIDKVRNDRAIRNCVYQPLKKRSDILGLAEKESRKRRLSIRTRERRLGVDDEDEVVENWKGDRDFIYDKLLKKYVKPGETGRKQNG